MLIAAGGGYAFYSVAPQEYNLCTTRKKSQISARKKKTKTHNLIVWAGTEQRHWLCMCILFRGLLRKNGTRKQPFPCWKLTLGNFLPLAW